MSDPTPLKLAGKETHCIRFIVPIINKRLDEVVGGIGCQYNIELLQPEAQRTIKNYEEVSIMSIYTDNGFILASSDPNRIGKNMIDVETEFGDYINEASAAVKAGKEYKCFSYSQLLGTDVEMAIANVPLGSSKTTWSVMTGSTKDYIMRDVNNMTKFTIILRR